MKKASRPSDNRARKEPLASVIGAAARISGLLLVLSGIATLVFALLEVWALYFHPENILPLAAAIEHATRVDASLIGGAVAKSAGGGDTIYTFSYFLAWLLKLVLLLLIGKLAFWSIGAGRELVKSEKVHPSPPQIMASADNEKTILPTDYRPSHRLTQDSRQ